MSARWSTIDGQAPTELADSPRITHRMPCHAGTVLLGAQDIDLGRKHLLLSAQHHPARSASLLLCRRMVRDTLCAILPEQRGRVGPDNCCERRSERDGRLFVNSILPREACGV